MGASERGMVLAGCDQEIRAEALRDWRLDGTKRIQAQLHAAACVGALVHMQRSREPPPLHL